MTGAARATLLAAVVDRLARDGVRDTSLRQLAASVGTSQRMLSYHFGGREDLLAAVVEQVVAREVATLEQLAAEADDPLDALTRHWELVRERAAAFGPLYVELATHAMYGKPWAAELPEVLVTRYAEAFARIYRRELGPAVSRRLARLTLGVGRGLVFDLLLDGDVAAADEAVAEFTEMVRNRLRP